VYESVIDADRKSVKLFSGHGPAIAQAYNHMIMPLANNRDKHTQVIWGIYDFKTRFGREPEGMWLPETAADTETLEVLAEHGMKFTILAPHQAKRIRPTGSQQWQDVDEDQIDTTQTYLCRLPSGRTIALFFYNGKVAQHAAMGDLLENGDNFTRQLIKIFPKSRKSPQLAHIATDGETYGHHRRHADMALAYALRHIESKKPAKLTVYGEHLEKFPPEFEVEIHDNRSWSCRHGIERWRSNCGCHYGRYPAGLQQWRGPLREAMDWLSKELASAYQQIMGRCTDDPWAVRNKYIAVINDRSDDNVNRFLSEAAGKDPSREQKAAMLNSLEMQRSAMLMYTSCGWFFDDICSIEAVQIMRYAAKAIELAKEVSGKDLNPGFETVLEKAPANAKGFVSGKHAYEVLVKARTEANRKHTDD
jgi:alpha-amylase/alpha-mannosidase (GH57 family)